jgi:flagellin
MGMSVVTNVAAVAAHRTLALTDDSMTRSLERLSSGLRITRAADDAAGLAISSNLRARISGMGQAIRNAQDGISVVRTADGALGSATSILQRMRDLSVQAANDGGLDDRAKESVQKEIGGSTVADAAVLTPGYAGQSGASAAIQLIDDAVEAISSQPAYLGAVENRFDHAVGGLTTAMENTTATMSRITDADLAFEVTAYSRNQIITQAGTAMLSHAVRGPEAILTMLG